MFKPRLAQNKENLGQPANLAYGSSVEHDNEEFLQPACANAATRRTVCCCRLRSKYCASAVPAASNQHSLYG